MKLTFPEKVSRIGLNLFFALLTLGTIVMGIVSYHRSRSWLVSDWLINYEGGFVRRGFAGQVAYLFGRLLHIRPEYLAVFFYLGLFVFFLQLVRRLSVQSSMNVWILAMVLNPGTFSFQILHPNAGFRKEVIFFAALGLLLVLLQSRKLSSTFVSAYISVVLVCGIFSHEAITFYVPYFFAALILADRTFAQAVREFIVPAVASLVAFYLCATHLGSAQSAMQICSSIGYQFDTRSGLEVCAGGAIPYLAKSRSFARGEALYYIREFHFLRVFPGFALLALLPMIGESVQLVRSGMRSKIVTLWSLALVSFLGSIVLFMYGIDWGRWIYIHLCSLAMLLIFLDGKQERHEQEDQVRFGAELPRKRAGLQLQIVCAALLFVYATCWLLPNTFEPIHYGYMERLGRLLHVWPESRTNEFDPAPLI